MVADFSPTGHLFENQKLQPLPFSTLHRLAAISNATRAKIDQNKNSRYGFGGGFPSGRPAGRFNATILHPQILRAGIFIIRPMPVRKQTENWSFPELSASHYDGLSKATMRSCAYSSIYIFTRSGATPASWAISKRTRLTVSVNVPVREDPTRSQLFTPSTSAILARRFGLGRA